VVLEASLVEPDPHAGAHKENGNEHHLH
jgi:hypothetical protein